MDVLYIAILGVFLGVLTRTVLPYLRKRKEAIDNRIEGFRFDLQYAVTGAYAILISGVITILIFPSFVIPNVPTPYIFASAFTFGYTSNDVINEMIS